MKIAIVGANGQLGFDLLREFENTEHEIFPLTHQNIEIFDFGASDRVLNRIQPDIVINSAAYVRVDDCEDHAVKAFEVNALGARNIAKICKALNATLMYISTDYVFDGAKKQPYIEEDIPRPINVYGCSKLAGEFFIRSILEEHYIVRSASLYGIAGSRGKNGNFVESMIKKNSAGEEIEVVNDIFMSPTYTKDLAFKIRELLDSEAPYGIYHMAGSGYCSWFDFAERIFVTLGVSSNLKPIKMEEFPYKAPRPRFSSLENKKIKALGLKDLKNWENGLKDYLTERAQKKSD